MANDFLNWIRGRGWLQGEVPDGVPAERLVYDNGQGDLMIFHKPILSQAELILRQRERERQIENAYPWEREGRW